MLIDLRDLTALRGTRRDRLSPGMQALRKAKPELDAPLERLAPSAISNESLLSLCRAVLLQCARDLRHPVRQEAARRDVAAGGLDPWLSLVADDLHEAGRRLLATADDDTILGTALAFRRPAGASTPVALAGRRRASDGGRTPEASA